jgi:outer membrane protein assembly factor BamB
MRFSLSLLAVLLGFGFVYSQDIKNDKTSEHSIEIVIPTFLGNDQRNYYGNVAPSNLNVKWKKWLGKGTTIISRRSGSRTWAGAGWTGQPLYILEDGIPYLIQGAYDFNLKKIDARDGSIVWQYKFDDVIKGTGTAWVNPNAKGEKDRVVIFQGSRLGVGNYLDTKHIPSFRAISYLTGEELWRFDVKWTGSYSRDVDGSALVVNDTLYIGLENSLFTLLNPNPAKASMKNEMLQPKIYSEHRLYRNEDVVSHKSNVVTEGSVSRLGSHFYLASGSGRVFRYNSESGKLDWEFFIGSDIDGTPIVTSDSCILVSIEKQYIPGRGGMVKLDPRKDPDQAVVWFHPTEDATLSSWEGGIIGSAGTTESYNDKSLVAFVGIDGYLYVVDHKEITSQQEVSWDGNRKFNTPKLVFKDKTGASIATPIFSNNRLIVATYNGLYLYSYDQDNNFERLAHFPSTFESTPIFMDGKIYVASRDGYMYCFGD